MTSTTPTFRVHVAVRGNRLSPASWNSRYMGRPSAATLAQYVADLEASCLPGGCNAHLGAMQVYAARIVRQSTGETVATFPATSEI